ncbi:hypothetical protein CSW77_23900 [Shigella flexneri]|nr:hypothetical protein CSW77_23900 [Shigella flexneri]
MGYPQTNRKIDTGKTLTRWPVFVDHFKAENDALRRKLDNGGRVLVKGKCPVPSSAETSSASGMGNDATVELSPVAGRNVLGIRDGIISDQTALRMLQEYIRIQCLGG